MDDTILAHAGQSPATPLATLATEINLHHRQAESAIQSGLEHAHEAGRLLIEAKSQCEHGQWGPWLEANFEGSKRTARAYMQVVKRWPEIEAKRQTSADLSIDGALRLLASPKAEIGEVVGKAAEVVDDPFPKISRRVRGGAWSGKKGCTAFTSPSLLGIQAFGTSS